MNHLIKTIMKTAAMMIFIALSLIVATILVLAVLESPPALTIFGWVFLSYTAQRWWM